jgi:hypothetical protein
MGYFPGQPKKLNHQRDNPRCGFKRHACPQNEKNKEYRERAGELVPHDWYLLGIDYTAVAF